MGISFDEVGKLIISLSAFGTVVFAALILLFGSFIKKRVAFFGKYCIPVPVIGGIAFALLNLFFHQTGMIGVELNKAYQNDFQFLFFTTIGFGASFGILKKGGTKLIIYFILTACMILLQSGIGILGASIAGIDPIFAIVCGPASLAGGHGSVAAYGAMLEDMGHNGSLLVGLAAATFGLVVGSFSGGPLCGRLIRIHNLKNEDTTASYADVDNDMRNAMGEVATFEVTTLSIIKHIALLGGFVVVGNYLVGIAKASWGFAFPGFLGGVLIAIIVRNILDVKPFLEIDQRIVDKISEISLGLFLAMALVSLNLWELFDLALPMLIILSLEVVFTLSFIYFIVFYCLGRNFDAAVMCAGFTGHSFGATPNGIANMESVSEKYGISRLAFLIVPLVGGFLQDLILVPVNVFLINYLG